MAKSAEKVKLADEADQAPKDEAQPKDLSDETVKLMSGPNNKLLSVVVDKAKANPIPIALIGLGVAWWAISQRPRASEFDPYSGGLYYETYEGYDEALSVAERLKAKARGAARTARQKVPGAVAQVKDRLIHPGATSRQARRRVQDAVDAEPVVLAVIGLALGAAIGVILASRVGSARDRAAADSPAPIAKKQRHRAAESASPGLDEVESGLTH